jgi:hypothetical protein
MDYSDSPQLNDFKRHFFGARIYHFQIQVMGLGFLTDCYAYGVRTTILDECPRLKALVERVGDHPKVKEWNAAHQ